MVYVVMSTSVPLQSIGEQLAVTIGSLVNQFVDVSPRGTGIAELSECSLDKSRGPGIGPSNDVGKLPKLVRNGDGKFDVSSFVTLRFVRT